MNDTDKSQKLTVSDGEHLPYEYYVEEHNALSEGKRSARSSIDKATAAGAGGALALSVAFLADIAQSPVAGSLGFLKWGWVLLVLALVVSLASFATSERAFDRALHSLEERRQTGVEPDQQRSWDFFTTTLNRVSLAALAGGVICLMIFAWLNVSG